MAIDEKLGKELSEKAKEMVITHERWNEIKNPRIEDGIKTIDDVFIQAGSWLAEVMFRESDRPLLVIFPERAPCDRYGGCITSSRLAKDKQIWAMFSGLIHRFIERPEGLTLHKVMFGQFSEQDGVSVFACTEEPKDASHIVLHFEIDPIMELIPFEEKVKSVACGKFFQYTNRNYPYFYLVLDIHQLPIILTKRDNEQSNFLAICIDNLIDFNPLSYQQLFEDIQYNENCHYLLEKEEAKQKRWEEKCALRKFRDNRKEFISKAHELFPNALEFLTFRRDYFRSSGYEKRCPYDLDLFNGVSKSDSPLNICLTYQKSADEQAEYDWFKGLVKELTESVEFSSFLKQHDCKDIHLVLSPTDRVEMSLDGFKSLPGIPTTKVLEMKEYSRKSIEKSLIDWLVSLKMRFDKLDRAYIRMLNLYYARLAKTPTP